MSQICDVANLDIASLCFVTTASNVVENVFEARLDKWGIGRSLFLWLVSCIAWSTIVFEMDSTMPSQLHMCIASSGSLADFLRI